MLCFSFVFWRKEHNIQNCFADVHTQLCLCYVPCSILFQKTRTFAWLTLGEPGLSLRTSSAHAPAHTQVPHWPSVEILLSELYFLNLPSSHRASQWHHSLEDPCACRCPMSVQDLLQHLSDDLHAFLQRPRREWVWAQGWELIHSWKLPSFNQFI